MRGMPPPPVNVEIVDAHPSPVTATGPVHTAQEAVVELPREILADLWQPEQLERLARAYWLFLQRISLGMLRVVYTRSTRSVVLFHESLTLLRFRRPEYLTSDVLGQVTWRIDRGLLVVRPGRGRGFLRFTVRRPLDEDPDSPTVQVRVRAEVSNFYPFIRGTGWFARLGSWIYAQTQLRIHVLVTHGFLRSLAKLDLPPSPVGALSDDDDAAEDLPPLEAGG